MRQYPWLVFLPPRLSLWTLFLCSLSKALPAPVRPSFSPLDRQFTRRLFANSSQIPILSLASWSRTSRGHRTLLYGFAVHRQPSCLSSRSGLWQSFSGPSLRLFLPSDCPCPLPRFWSTADTLGCSIPRPWSPWSSSHSDSSPCQLFACMQTSCLPSSFCWVSSASSLTRPRPLCPFLFPTVCSTSCLVMRDQPVDLPAGPGLFLHDHFLLPFEHQITVKPSAPVALLPLSVP